MRFAAPVLAALMTLFSLCGALKAQVSPGTGLDRTHDTEEWANIAAHLPDTRIAAPAKLEEAADVLRARRYPTDAMLYYNAALARGGDPHVLLKKMGITCLGMQQVEVARIYFQRALRLDKRDAGAWNDFGATEFILHDTGSSIRAYRRAVKLDKSSAVFHSNLALAYFEAKQGEEARQQLRRALDLDPNLLHRGNDEGYIAQVLPSQSYPEICFEMARIYAAQGDVPAMLDWLTKASERGFDVRKAMNSDATLRSMLADKRVQLILKNAGTLRAATRPTIKPPSLGSAPQP